MLTMLSGCADNVTEHTLVDPSTSRPYRVYVSKTLRPNEKRPVLFVLHAYATEPHVLMDAYSLKRNAVEKRNWIVVLPEGRIDDDGKRFWNATKACCGATSEPSNDLDYLKSIFPDIKRRFPVDETAVYALGVSNGAFMAHRWACAPHSALRSIVTISGLAPGPADPPCAPPGRPIRVLQIHGDEDGVIRYQGKQDGEDAYPSAKETVMKWIELNGLPRKPKIETQRKLLLGKVRKETWSGPSSEVRLWTVVGGGHNLRWLRLEVSTLLDFFEGLNP